ncbi:9099_t:CDS:1, partial [Dentiscutata erythropus]
GFISSLSSDNAIYWFNSDNSEAVELESSLLGTSWCKNCEK